MKKLGFGCMRLPTVDGRESQVDFERFCQMVDRFLERGFNYFDTAYMYHDFKSECFVRDALVRRHPRESFVLADKLPTMFLKSEDDLERIFNEQLEKCGVEYFDYYLLHNLGVANYKTAQRFGAFEFISQQKAAGRVKKIGFSFHDTAAVLDEILTDHPEVDFVQLQLNYLDWDNESIQSGECYRVATGHGKPVIVMEPIKGGSLATLPDAAERLLLADEPGRSIASWAIRFAAGLENVMMVLSGMSDERQLDDNTSYMADFVPLSERQQQKLQTAVDIINRAITVPCTACRYCVKGCPAGIPIPEYFSLLNAENQVESSGWSTQHEYYSNLSTAHAPASACMACGACEAACPQHIDIIKQLRVVARTFE